jgi:DUF3089 family protein
VKRLALLPFALLAIWCAPANAKVVWLCLPGHRPDPCTPGLSTTVYTPRLQKLRVTHPKAVRVPRVDCFYVYPTVSDQKTYYANLQIDPEERSIALMQAARFSQYCRVFAPMYRQHTLSALLQSTTLPPVKLGLSDVEAAFRTYLHRYNRGRGFVLIGHSQGARVLEQLIAKLIDPRPELRRRMLSAILLGANVLVKRGKRVGGTFKHIPACRSASQLGCVIAYSSFDTTPPADSMFGRSPVASEQVLCTNPAALGGGSGRLNPIFPSTPFAPGTLLADALALMNFKLPAPPTVWASEPGSYSAACATIDGARVLELKPLGGAQPPTPSPSPMWGLHLLDVNLALGNLVAVVKAQAAAYAKRP